MHRSSGRPPPPERRDQGQSERFALPREDRHSPGLGDDFALPPAVEPAYPSSEPRSPSAGPRYSGSESRSPGSGDPWGPEPGDARAHRSHEAWEPGPGEDQEGRWPGEDLLPEEERNRWGGPEGNERLTAITGATLLVLFAAEGLTILRLGPLLYWHFFLGLLLIGPVCLKLGAVLYRFTRYYTGSPAYVRKGPPAPLLRLLGPFVVLSTVGVLGTGVALGLAGQPTYAGLPLLLLHKASFILWFGAMTIHVLSYVWRLPRLIGSDLPSPRVRRAQAAIGSRGLRWSLAAACLAAGLGIAVLGSHLAATWRHDTFGPPPASSTHLPR